MGAGRRVLGAERGAAAANPIINGNLDFWQRGVLQTTLSGLGSDDRWNNIHGARPRRIRSRRSRCGQTEVPGNPRFFSRSVVASVAGAANFCYKGQKIEGVRTLAGTTSTLTFWAKAAAPQNLAVEVMQDFGAGGAPSGDVNLACGLKALTTAWQKVSFTVAIPGIAGKTLRRGE